MAIVKKKLVNSVVKFRLPSTASDIDCPDGEVASFRNVNWLSDTSSGNSSGTPGTSSSSSKPSETSTKLRLITSPASVNLPPGSRLLAIHSPENLHGEKRYIFLAPSDIIGVYTPDSDTAYMPGMASRTVGEIRNVIQHGNIIMIIGSITSGYIVYNPGNDSYSFTVKTPKSPEISFSTSPAHVARYTQAAGAMPLLSASVDLKLADIGNSNNLSNWLDNGISSALSESIREKIYKSVGTAVAGYITEMHALGYMLTPAYGIASIDSVLPTAPALIDTHYHPPFALLQSWSYGAEILTLNFYFSMLPYELSTNFRRDGDDKIWDSQFADIRFHISEQVQWRYNPAEPLKAVAYTSYIDPSTERHTGFAFRFPSFTTSELEERISDKENLNFRTVGNVSVGNATAGSIMIRTVYSSGSPFIPDYDDNTVVTPSDGVAIDQGIAIWGGTASLTDSDGHTEATSLEKSIMVSHPGYPMIFRHKCHISDGSVVAVMQGNGSRSSGESGRHPLYVISTDGIRKLTADGNGGYLNSSLVSHEGAIENSLTASSSERTFYLTPFGIRSLSLDGSRKSITSEPLADGWDEMRILRDNETILFRKPGRCLLIASSGGSQFEISDISVRPLLESEGQLYMTENSGQIVVLSSERYIPAEQNMKTEESEVSESAEFHEQRSGIMSITTRPLKISSATSYKSIWGIHSLSPEIHIRTEGSDDMQNWELIAEFRGAMTAIRVRPYRFFRLALTAPPTVNSDLLRMVKITTLTA